MVDESDVYFLKYASSWGQVWSREQWERFRKWYDENEPRDSSREKSLPPNIRLWPENSWKKYFIEYLIKEDRYFVFPRVSFTTIFGDAGTNIRIRETFLQVPLWYGKRPFLFKSFEDSCAVYDTWCEIIPDRLKRLWPEMKDKEFDVDLYGMKSSEYIYSDNVISGRTCKSPVMSFAREMKPHEENLVKNLPGDYLHFGRKEDFRDSPYLVKLLRCHEKKELSYWYPIREYHFYKSHLLVTEKNSFSLADPVFICQKVLTSMNYAWRYFFKRKK